MDKKEEGKKKGKRGRAWIKEEKKEMGRKRKWVK